MSTRDAFPLQSVLNTVLHAQTQAIVDGDDAEMLDRVTPVTSELLRYWFQSDFCDVRDLNFHEGQRAAILSVIYVHEVIDAPDLPGLYQALNPEALLSAGVLSDVSHPRNSHPKYAVKMATGTGKTWVLNALLIWQYLNRAATPDDYRFTNNFLVVAPGLIVYERLLDSFVGKERDGVRNFETSDLFQNRELFVPAEHRDAVFSFVKSNVTTKAEIGRKTTSGGLIAITNWHLLAGEEDQNFVEEVEAPGQDIDAKVAVESMFPITPGVSAGNSLDALDRSHLRGGPLQSLKELPHLMVFNDEAHHIHELKKGGEVSEVEWQKSLTEIATSKGRRFVQVDFSATPFNEVGGRKKGRQWFPHIIVDFDLTSAMRTGLVKALALDKRNEVASLPLEFRAERDERGRVVALSEGQRIMLRAGLTKLRRLESEFTKTDGTKHPKMLVVCEDTEVVPHVMEFLRESGLGDSEILEVHSNKKNEVPPGEWKLLREKLFDLDRRPDPKVVVSVLMLREGFDVNNICVIVPLRSSRAQILLEQTIGRGLRLMWRGDDRIDEAKRETRERLAKRESPENFFDVLFIVEHPAFSQFYDDLLADGLIVGEVDDDDDGVDPTGDIESVALRDGYEQYDFAVPMIVRDAEEELKSPSVDPLQLPTSKYPIGFLLKQIGKGDRFISHDAQTGTQYGDYRVAGGVMTATGYNDYLSRMTRRISEALSGGTPDGHMTRSAKTYSEASRFPFLQVQRPVLTGWIDSYIRGRLFDGPFDPLDGENWRVLLVNDVARHIASTFASALVKGEGNEMTGEPEIHYRRLSEIAVISVRTSSCVEVTKSIYPKLPVPKRSGGLERTFIEWLNSDTEIEAFTKIIENKHLFVRRPYMKFDGMPGNYFPDFFVRTATEVYVVETKSQEGLASQNVQRKELAALNWCERLNELESELRGNRAWHYVLLGETIVKDWKSKGARASELLDYARLRRKVDNQQETLL